MSVPGATSDYTCIVDGKGFPQLTVDVKGILLEEYGINVNKGDFDILSMPLAPGFDSCAGGLANVCGSRLGFGDGEVCENWIMQFTYPVLGHECLHNLGLDHTGSDKNSNGECDFDPGEPVFETQEGEVESLNCAYG